MLSMSQRMRHFSYIIKAWKYLLSAFLIALCYGYFGGLILIYQFGMDPSRLFKLSTIGLQYIGAPVFDRGVAIGIDPAIIIFAFNTIATLAIASFLFSSPLLNPDRAGEFPVSLRRSFLRDRTINIFYPFKAFRAVSQKQLRPAFVWLSIIPPAPLVLLGLMAGGMMSSGHAVLGSLGVVAASLIPHGIFEIPAVVLGAAIPFSAYYLVQADLEAGATEKVFRKISRFARSRAIKVSILSILLLLAVASIIEAHLTGTIAEWVKTS